MYRTVVLAFFAALTVAATDCFALEPAALGTVYQNVMPLEQGIAVPLPAGDYRLVGWRIVKGTLEHSLVAGKPRHFILLVDPKSSSHVREIEIEFSEDASTIGKNGANGFQPSTECGKTDYLHIVVTSNVNGGDQDCWMVNHYPMDYEGRKQDNWKAAVEYFKSVGANNPRTEIQIYNNLANRRNKLQATYYFNPEAEKFKRDSSLARARSDWHPVKVADDPKKVAYIEKLKAWGAEWHAKLKDGLAGKLAPKS
jgi:hypothetical protein